MSRDEKGMRLYNEDFHKDFYNEDTHKYDDIINLPHHRSVVRAHMPLADRAAQFAPFAALTGYNEAIWETQRLTEERIIQIEKGTPIED